MKSTSTFTHNLTYTFTNTITKTYTHTNSPFRKDSVGKGLQGSIVKNSIEKNGVQVGFNHLSYPPTLPGRLIPVGGKPPAINLREYGVIHEKGDTDFCPVKRTERVGAGGRYPQGCFVTFIMRHHAGVTYEKASGKS